MASETIVDLLIDFVLAVMSGQYSVCYPGKSNGAGGYDIEVVNDPGKWWIRTWKNGVVAIDKAVPMGVPRDPQQRCLTRVISGERIIEMPDPTSLRLLYGNYANGAAVGNIPTPVEGGDKGALGIVAPSSAGGMNVSISAYPAGGLLNPVDPVDLSGDEPGTPGQFLWDVAYSLNGVVSWAQSSAVSLTDVSLLAIADALAVAVPTGAYRLYAVSLANGQANINQSRFVNLQDDLVKTGEGTLSVTDGSTTVTPVTEINFTSGATVTDAGGGMADVAVTGGGGSLTCTDATLGADVTMTTANTYYDAVSVSLAAGTWLISANAEATCAGSATDFTAQIWDGASAVYASAQSVRSGASASLAALMSITPRKVVLSGTTTVKLSVAGNNNTCVIRAAAQVNGVGNNATWITALQIA